MTKLYIAICFGLVLSASCVVAGEATLSLDSPVAKEYYAAYSSVSNLQVFISQHPEEPGWCGEAQIRIGLTLQQEGIYTNALAAYQRAIDNYSTNIAPDRCMSMQVGDIANLHKALCLEKMGRLNDAREALTNIRDPKLRKSWLTAFEQRQKKRDRTTKSTLSSEAAPSAAPSER